MYIENAINLKDYKENDLIYIIGHMTDGMVKIVAQVKGIDYDINRIIVDDIWSSDSELETNYRVDPAEVLQHYQNKSLENIVNETPSIFI